MNLDFSSDDNNSQENIREENIKDIVLSTQQRNGRKYWTYIENYNPEDRKKFIKVIKKAANCNGSYNKDDSKFQFQGKHVELIKNILVKQFQININNIST